MDKTAVQRIGASCKYIRKHIRRETEQQCGNRSDNSHDHHVECEDSLGTLNSILTQILAAQKLRTTEYECVNGIQDLRERSVKAGNRHGIGAYEITCECTVYDDIDAAAHNQKDLYGYHTEEKPSCYLLVIPVDHKSCL